MNRSTIFVRLLLVTPLAVTAVALATAGEVSIPHTFTSGTTARAAEVNANFEAVRTEINDNDARIEALENQTTGERFLTVGSASLRPDESPLPSGVTWRGGVSAGSGLSGGDGGLVAPVRLPHGATITSMTVYFYDTSSSDVFVQLRTHELAEGTANNRILVSSDSDTGRYERSSGPVSVEVDNETYTYVVAATSLAWESTLRIQGVVLTYTLP